MKSRRSSTSSSKKKASKLVAIQEEEIVAFSTTDNHVIHHTTNKNNHNHGDKEDEKDTTQAENRQRLASNNNSNSKVIWYKEEERWELTWPIWHMLPRDERKALADRYGFHTLGDLEEYLTLQRAVGESSSNSSIQKPYDNNLIYAAQEQNRRQQPNPSNQHKHHTEEQDDEDTNNQRKPKAKQRKKNFDHHNDDEDDDDDDEEENQKMELKLQNEQEKDHETNRKMLEQQQQQERDILLQLPEEVIFKIFDCLCVDMYATLARVSPHWKGVTRTETIYKRLCERIYLQQSKRRALHVSRFQYSYRTMLEQRPRVRAHGGVYVMKYTRVKTIQRDMWTEIPVGAILESTYYRYLYFLEDGRVLYALTSASPHDMFRRFYQILLKSSSNNNSSNSSNTTTTCSTTTSSKSSSLKKSASCHNNAAAAAAANVYHVETGDAATVWGTFQVQKCSVTVIAKQPWQWVRLGLSIRPERNEYGRFGYLQFDSHVTSNTPQGFFPNDGHTYEEQDNNSQHPPWHGAGNYNHNESVIYDVPEEPFVFVRDRRL